jgi:hypothetical protein
MFPSVLASGPIHPDSPSRDPNPPPNPWFSAFFHTSTRHTLPNLFQGILDTTSRGWDLQRIRLFSLAYRCADIPQWKGL